jgi:predicted RNA-binding protein with RPS1 domain
MEKVITKELLSQVLRLESHQQEKVLLFIKDLLEDDEMNKRAQASEEAIKYGNVKSFEDFNSDFENWKARKRESIK